MDEPNSNDRPLTPADSSPPLAGERVAFTGTLASMSHARACELVGKLGGVATQHVSKQTTMLVVGEEGWPLEDDGRVSVKLQRVNRWRQEGLDIRVLSESEWLRLIGLEGREREVRRLYTPAMLSQMLDVPVYLIRRWERRGLIRPVRRTYRLPYFDLREVASVRRLSELLRSGVPPQKLEQSLAEIRSLLPDPDRPLAQLKLLVQGGRVLVRKDSGLVEPRTGQRHFDFSEESSESVAVEIPSAAPGEPAEGPRSQRPSVRLPHPGQPSPEQLRWSCDDWYEQGCRLLDEGDPNGAVEAFRLCLMDSPSCPETHFQLAEALYRAGKTEAALERYHVAVELDHQYLEAWTQLGSLYLELGQPEAALEAFDIALGIDDDYPDAVYMKAQTLDQLGRGAEAANWWRRYLQFDSRGPWAEQARERLRQLASSPSER